MAKKYEKVLKNVTINSTRKVVNTSTSTVTGLFGVLKAVITGVAEGVRTSDAAPLAEKAIAMFADLGEDQSSVKPEEKAS